jgi:hypothetical protein
MNTTSWRPVSKTVDPGDEEDRMRTQKALIIGAALVVIHGVLAVAQSRMRPGQYELTTDMTIAGKRAPTMTTSDCITADVLKDAPKLVIEAAQDQNCTISDLVRAADRMTFNFTCTEDGVRYVSRTEMTFGTDSYSAAVTTTAEGQTTITTMKARRTGECK